MRRTRNELVTSSRPHRQAQVTIWAYRNSCKHFQSRIAASGRCFIDANIAITQFTSAAIVVWGSQKLKQAAWFPLFKEGQAAIIRIWSVFWAFVIHAGVSYTWDPVLDANGNRHLTLAIPTLWGAAILLWHWLGQYAMQETLYQATAPKK